MFRTAKDIDDVDLLARIQDIVQMIEVGDRLLTEDGSTTGCDRDDPVAEALKVLCHTVAGSRRVCGQSNNSDDPRRAQKLVDLVGGWVFEHWFLPAAIAVV